MLRLFLNIALILSLVAAVYVLTRDQELVIPAEISYLRPPATLTGLNCSMTDGIMKVKTSEMWDSRVVEARI